MKEEEFISQVDCRFPYNDRQEATRLIALGCSISLNAALTVAHELALLPRSAQVARQTRLALLAELKAQLAHPLKDLVLSIVKRLIIGEFLSVPEAITSMQQIGPYPGQYQALNIAYFSAADATEELESVYEQVVYQWNQTA